MPGGRPTKYDPKMCDEVMPFMSQGYSKEALAGHFGISGETLRQWIEEHDEFSAAIKEGIEASRHEWERIGVEGSKGSKCFNATGWIFNMKNRFGWRDRHEISGDDAAPFVVNVNLNADND